MQLRSLLITTIITLGMMGDLFAAAVKVRDVTLEQLASKNRLTIKYSGKMNGAPEMVIRDQMLQVALPDAIVWPRIEKRAKADRKKFDTTLMAYQYNKQLVRVRAMLPYSLKYHSGDVAIKVKKGRVEVTFPRTNATAANSKKEASQYDESYLAGLLKDKLDHKRQGSDENAALDHPSLNLNRGPAVTAKQSVKMSDEVKVAQFGLNKAGSAKSGSQSFLLEYVAKFVVFLVVVLGIFYGVMHLFKKGVLKRGNFSFLDNSKLVTVMNTTYLGPKRSLMLVKVNQQIFLLGSSESGINMISEIDSPSALLKEGEQVLSGSNFDNVYDRAEITDKSVKLKEESKLEASSSTPETDNSLGSRGVKQQIKNRLKNIKSLQ
jgi:flagellar biosynthetic protein FliO